MNTSVSTSILQKKLSEIVLSEPNTIRAAVAQEALDFYPSEIASFFSQLMNWGCSTGIVHTLRYFHDTHAFYDKHYQEIEDLRHDYESIIGQPIKVDSDYKNFMAWFAFEETAYQMTNELGLEI